LVGFDIFKAPNGALRNMATPTPPSIGHASDYYYGLDVHYSSGVYNKAFYTLAISDGWDTQSAFQVFAYANKNLWTPRTSFRYGAFAVRDAVGFVFPGDTSKTTTEVETAFATVGINLGPVCGFVPLANGDQITISDDEGSWTCFSILAAPGSDRLTVTLTEVPKKGRWKTGAGDPDLYVRLGLVPDPSDPETAVEIEEEGYDCRSISPGGNESCVIDFPPESSCYTDGCTAYAGVYGWSAFNNIRVEALLEGGSGPPTPPPTAEITVTATSGGNGKFVRVNWSGATATTVDIYRDDLFGEGIPIANNTANDGSYKDNGGGSGMYQVCQEEGAVVCSDPVLVP